MKKQVLFVSSLALAMLFSTSMFADSIFNFSFTGNSSASGTPPTPFSGSGQFDAQATATAGKFLITGVTGTTDGQAITGIVRKNGFGGNDNFLFYTSGGTPSLDNSGVSYLLANGIDVNVFLGVPSQYQQSIFGVAGGQLIDEEQVAPVSIVPASPVPEPGTLVLLGTGVLGMAGAIRRRLGM